MPMMGHDAHSDSANNHPSSVAHRVEAYSQRPKASPASVGAHADLGAGHLGAAAHVAPAVRRVWTGVGSVHGVLVRFFLTGCTLIQIAVTLGYV
jgi:hypothetical protein